jgi:hypothetical protein
MMRAFLCWLLLAACFTVGVSRDPRYSEWHHEDYPSPAAAAFWTFFTCLALTTPLLAFLWLAWRGK